jgi:hypothetical protein
VAAFEAAGRDDRARVATVRVRRVFARSVAVKAVAAVAVVMFGGTALAAETGNLPGRSQQHAHNLFSALGVPPPSARATPTTPSAAPTTPSAGPGATASSGGRTATPGLTSPATAGLCRSWMARQKKPKHKPLKAEALRKLATAAGGEEHIAAFCTALLGGGPAGPPTQGPGTVVPTPSHPGNGNGHGKPTPNPHKKG